MFATFDRKTSCSVIALLLWVAPNAFGKDFLCISGTLYKPDGTETYVGSGACASAKMFASMACVAGTVYQENGQSRYLGVDACQNAKMSPSFFCADKYLFHKSGWSQYTARDCKEAFLTEEFACVGGNLYRADGSITSVGSQGCQSASPK